MGFPAAVHPGIQHLRVFRRSGGDGIHAGIQNGCILIHCRPAGFQILPGYFHCLGQGIRCMGQAFLYGFLCGGQPFIDTGLYGLHLFGHIFGRLVQVLFRKPDLLTELAADRPIGDIVDLCTRWHRLPGKVADASLLMENDHQLLIFPGRVPYPFMPGNDTSSDIISHGIRLPSQRKESKGGRQAGFLFQAASTPPRNFLTIFHSVFPYPPHTVTLSFPRTLAGCHSISCNASVYLISA